jgi:Tol biopolymer transport system component
MPRSVSAATLAALLISSFSPNAWADDDPKSKAGKILARADDMAGKIPGDQQFHGMILIDPETGEFNSVGAEGTIAGTLSPDRRYLAGVVYRGGEAEIGVWVEDLTGKMPRRRVFKRSGFPSWADGGKTLVIGSLANAAQGTYETYRINPDGTGLTELPVDATEYVLDCTPDGSWLASSNPKANRRDSRRHILLSRPDGTETRELIDENHLALFRVSPDGREVVYALVTQGEAKVESHLWLVNINGTDRRRIPIDFGAGVMVRPVWSPDGKRLALGVTRLGVAAGQRSQILLIDRDGRNSKTLALPDWQLSVFDWK